MGIVESGLMILLGPIASMIWHNEEYALGLGKDIALDGVICVVDAVFGKQVGLHILLRSPCLLLLL